MIDLEEILKYSKNINLLYVEDNKDTKEATLMILEEFFDNVKVATNGEDGLALFKMSKIDLVITDINIPKLNGLNMIEAIRKINKEIFVIILSAHDDSDFFRKSISLGVNSYLLKPIDITQFSDVLKRVVQTYKLKDEAKRDKHLLDQYQEAIDKSSIISKADINGNLTYANESFIEISQYSIEELVNDGYKLIRHPESSPSVYETMWYEIKNKKTIWQGVIRNINKSGGVYYISTTIKPILDENGVIVEYISISDDITEIMSPKKQLQDLNSSYLQSIVVLMQIERFDDIEKYYGIEISQNIEEKFSTEILNHVPQSCGFSKIYNLSGGEYAFSKNKDECIIGVDNVIKNLKQFRDSIANSKICVNDLEYDISVRVSIAYGVDALENAKYGLKEMLNTKQNFIIANNLAKKEREQSKKNFETLKMLKRAIEDYKIISYFQPIVNNKTEKIEKYESLVRLIDVDDNIISPFAFLDAAKKGNYYSQITTIVLENSFGALSYTDMDISINLSILDIEKNTTREYIFNLLNKHKINLHRVVFELLEDEDVKDFELVSLFISKVKSMGVKIAIDDFGAGYSNFERLLDYKPDIIKIDGSLVRNIERETLSINVVETIVAFAKKQKIKVIAEYVENENIFNILKGIGVDYSQGYFFGKPQELLTDKL